MKTKKWMKQSEKILHILCLCVLPYINVTKGIDFCDIGYSIMLFQNSGRHYSYWMLSTFLSNLLGGFFMKLPGGETYVGVKAYCLIVVSVMVVGIYIFLSRFFQNRLVFLGLIIALAARWCPGVVLYNYLSYLLFYGAIILIVLAFQKKKKSIYCFAGILLGLNVFVRLSNITQVILIIPIVVLMIWQKESVKNIFKTVGICILGFFMGSGSILTVIMIKYGMNDYLHMIESLRILSERIDTYSGNMMLSAYTIIFSRYALWLIPLIALIFIPAIFYKLFEKKKIKIIFPIISVGLFAVWLRYAHYWEVFTVRNYTSFISTEFWIFLGVIASVICSIMVIFRKNEKKDLCLLALINLCCIFIAPLGTDAGFLATINNLYFIMPFMLGALWKFLFEERTFSRKKLWQGISPIMAISFLTVSITLVQTVLFGISYVYGDVQAKDLKAAVENNKVLKNAELLNGMDTILSEITDYVQENDLEGTESITFGNIPTMSFVLNMPSELSTSWPDLANYLQEDFDTELSGISKDRLPVVILNKWYFFGKDVFNKEIQRDLPKAKSMAEFLEENHYILTFENDKFQIYETRK